MDTVFSQIANQKDKRQLTSKSVLKPFAQYTTLYAVNSESIVHANVLLLIRTENPRLIDLEKALIELMYYYGLRISEVLQIKASDVLPNGSIIIKGKKRSSNRVVTPVNYISFWKIFKINSLSIPGYYNRFYFYRLFLKLGIYTKISKNNKKAVTHSLRYNYINNFVDNGNTIGDIKNFIGHKSETSTNHYVAKLNRKKRPA